VGIPAGCAERGSLTYVRIKSIREEGGRRLRELRGWKVKRMGMGTVLISNSPNQKNQGKKKININETQ